MADIVTRQIRSRMMSGIRGRGNLSTEVAMARILRERHLTGWRRHRKLSLLGPRKFVRPDFVFRKERVALFIDGCFWHGCRKHCTFPSTNYDFWKDKLDACTARDRKINRELRQKGWKVIRIWEHELRQPGRVALRVEKVLTKLA